MTKTEYLEQICIALGIDVSVLPNRLLTTYLSAIAVHLGVDIASLENCTLSDWMQIIRDNAGNAGGGGGSYEQGFEDGKASVKHIKFWVEDEEFCALSGMTWRDFVDSDLFPDIFSIIDGKVYVWDSKYIDVGLDEVIVNRGYYYTLYPPRPFTLSYGGKAYTLYRDMNDGDFYDVWEFVNSSHNTLGLYVDDDGCLRTPTGEFVYYETIGDSRNYISNDTKINTESYSFSEYDYFIAERDCDCKFFVLGYATLYYPSGMTWQEYVDSRFNDTISIYNDEIVHDYELWNDALMLNGVKVLPTDVIVNGATYWGNE